MPRIPQDIIDQVLARVDIVQIVGESVPLKKAGANYKGVCPFHQEKTPSFTVHPGKQMFYCFGCGAGGDVFRFLMLHLGLGFPEAVQHVADRVGVSVPRIESTGASGADNPRRKLEEILNKAAETYASELGHPGGASALRYLKEERGLNEKILKQFEVGFAPDSWRFLTQWLARSGFEEQDLIRAGVATAHSERGTYDLMRNRIVFPLVDQRGRPVALAGRALGDSQPKYLNSPETSLYNKSRFLYGLNHAWRSISDTGSVVVVEGYLDVITAVQMGLANTVAVSGTALTEDHLKLLGRYASKLYLVFDGDAAGRGASLRNFEAQLRSGLEIVVVLLPEGQDPDSYLRGQGVDKFRQILEFGVPLFDHHLTELTRRYGDRTPYEKSRVASEMLVYLRVLENPILLDELLKKLGQRLSLDPRVLRNHLRSPGSVVERDENRSGSGAQASQTRDFSISAPAAEVMLLKAVITEPELLTQYLPQLPLGELQDEVVRSIMQYTIDFFEHEGEVSVAALSQRIEDDQVRNFLGRIALESDRGQGQRAEENASAGAQCVEDCIARIRKDYLHRRQSVLSRELELASPEEAGPLAEQLLQVGRALRDLSYEKAHKARVTPQR
ncbi:MAG: DNA primase [Candidatus Omnitrophica bacterium]|nr:DNA primase [Candidatus Omnitrophota bacterium]